MQIIWSCQAFAEQRGIAIRDSVILVTFARHTAVARGAVGWCIQGTAMKKLLVLVALGIFLAAHGVVTAMTFHPQLALVDGCGSLKC